MQNNYRHTRDVLKYSVVHRKRRRARMIKMSIYIFVLLCILIGLTFLVRMPLFAISEIQVKGLQSVSTQDVINEVDGDISGNYAFIFPKKNILFYPKSHIKDDLMKKFETFGDVQINTVDTNKLEVSVTEKKAIGISCQSDQSVTDKTFTNCFFVDSNGRTFQPVFGEPDQSLIRFVDANVNTASSTLASSTISETSKVYTDLNSKGFTVQYIGIIGSKDAEFKIVDNGKIIVSLPADDNLISILDTAINTKPLSSTTPFQYIDVRFGNKVFFKLGSVLDSTARQASSTLSATSTNATSSMLIKTSSSTLVATSSSSTVKSLVPPKPKVKKKK